MNDISNTVNPEKNVDVLTPEQISRCEEIIQKLKSFSKSVIKDYWLMGKHLSEIFSDADQSAKKYGMNAVVYISQKTGYSISELYRMHSVYVSYDEKQIEHISSLSVSLTNIIMATRIQDSKQRIACLEKAAENSLTVREFKEEVDAAVEAQKASGRTNDSDLSDEDDGDDEEDDAEEDKKVGIKSRPGTGRSESPLTPFRRLRASSQSLFELIPQVLIVLRSEDFQEPSSKLLHEFSLAVDDVMQLLPQLMSFIKVIEDVCKEQQILQDEKAQERIEVYTTIFNILKEYVPYRPGKIRDTQIENVRSPRRSRKRNNVVNETEDDQEVIENEVNEDDENQNVVESSSEVEEIENVQEDQEQQEVEQPKRRGRRGRKPKNLEEAEAKEEESIEYTNKPRQANEYEHVEDAKKRIDELRQKFLSSIWYH